MVDWKIFAGPSLHCPSVAPVQVALEDKVSQRLHEGDPEAWGILLAAVQHLLTKR